MSIRIGSNISSLQVQRGLSHANRELGLTFERLSSGLRINRASDDAAGLSVASGLGVNRRVFNQGVRNLNDGISLLNVAQGSLGQLSNIVIRQSELAEQAANGVLSETQRAALDLEAQTLFEEYERILNTTEFNGLNLLNGAFGSFTLQGGFGESGELDAVLRQGETTSDYVFEGLGMYTDYNRNWGGNTNIIASPTFLVGDLNNDGIDDIVAMKARASAPGQITTEVGFFLGEDGGTAFVLDDSATYISHYTGALSAVNIKAQFFDEQADGDLDVRISTTIVSSGTSEFLSGYIQNLTIEGGSFNMAAGLTGALNPISNKDSATVQGDFNNDGIQDQVTASASGAVISIQDTQSILSEVFVGESLEQTEFSLATQNGARSALETLKTNLNLINEIAARIGSSQSRVDTAAGVLQVSAENMAAAESQIMDADISFESAKLLRLSLLQQASVAILAQANQQPAIALRVLRSAAF